MHRAGGEVEEERLVRRDLFGVSDHRRGLLHQVGGQVVALLGGGLGFGLRIVAHEFGVVLVGVTAQEAVVALEPSPQRPAVVRPRRGHRLLGRQVPLPDAVGVVALCPQDLGEEPVLERDVSVRARVARRPVGQAGQVIRMVVAAGENARARRRTQRGGVHVGVLQAVGGQGVDVRCGDRAAVTAEVSVAGVVEDDEHHVGCVVGGPFRCRPGRGRLVRGAGDHAGKRCAGLILGDCH